MKRYCLALDLFNDPLLIDQYIEHHKVIWPEIIDSIKDSGIHDMQIFHVADRLLMIIEVQEGFSFEKKNKMDRQKSLCHQMGRTDVYLSKNTTHR